MDTTQAQMVKGGIATIFVTNMDRAVAFYTETLGFKLTYRAGEHWASIDAGDGFLLGLHPAGSKGPVPGALGGVQIGFSITGKMEEAISSLEAKGVAFPNGIHDDGGGIRLAFFKDPDGNEHYLVEQSH